MTTFAPAHHHQHHLPPASPPAAPSQAAIASRGRRPALIPHHADLSLSLSAASAALSSASYSPARDNKVANGLWVLPPPVPPPAFGRNMEVDRSGDEVRRDVFSWVNAPEDINPNQMQLDNSYSPVRAAAIMGPETAPASPTSVGLEEVERQKRRLEEAGKR